MREFAIGKCQFYFATSFGIALFLMNFAIVFEGTTLTTAEILVIVAFAILYICLIIMAMLEKTKPIGLMTDE
jgi:hypothetical protein